MLGCYLGAMWLSVEFLNRQKNYLIAHRYRLFNFIFGFYTLLVIINRTRTAQFSPLTEGVVNIAEHLFFGIVICLKISIYCQLFFKIQTLVFPIIVVLLFNILGIFNEVFQNWLCTRPLWFFIADAQKDILVNLCGSILFLIGTYWQKR